MVDYTEMHRRYSYDPSTGKLTRRFRVGKFREGSSVGSPGKSGYLQFIINGKQHSLHRVIWLMAYGREAVGYIDHVNGDQLDNRLANLRECNNSQNQANRRSSPGKLKGVTRLRGKGKWRAQIKVRGKSIHLGSFATADEAHEAYATASRKYFGEFARPA